ncbi:signal peptide peptidase-domain-containing protein [Triangularia verruculosa]|uniref:Signal peptide peptidase-domain-containing protein n=1 Tax=Triangularia verruculosa TaxID=2587418 RepID=A0AAN7AUG0_9PEZI|nr:signal peptide peptidase-domain-containing protein [Triangularia verruculosa]
MSSGNTTTDLTDGLSNSTAAQAPEPQDFALTLLLRPEYLSVVFSALAIIWLGAHGSLRRPPSAAPIKTKKGKKQPKEDKFAEGLAASDAIMFPVLAGILLISLYYLIEWLQDPDILNKFMRAYLSIMAVASLGRLSGDSLDILTSLVFPSNWVDNKGTVYHIDSDERHQYVVDKVTGQHKIVKDRISPLPGFLSVLARSETAGDMLWLVRHLLTEEWTVKFAMHGLVFVKFNLKLNDLLGFMISSPFAAAYHYLGWNILSNIMSAAMCYATFLLLSPTSFGIGTGVLWGLFVYDIVMVFYTPYMITVATKLDAPIKLVFENNKSVSMLGLGDIVVPGMLMGLALRFDLYQFYRRQIKLEPVELVSEILTEDGTKTTTTEVQERRVKAPFVDPQGQWGNRLWCTKFGSLFPTKEASSVWAATAFPKPYFYASMVGYTAGMLITLTMLLVFRHGQPALLYLVPGVTGALWVTALARGELKDVWGYTEDGSLDTEDVVVDVGPDSKAAEKKGEDAKSEGASQAEMMRKESKERGAEKIEKESYDVFHFSISAPRIKYLKED